MADVNAQSVEDYADRIVYRFDGGRYEQALTTWAGAVSPGLKTLVNTDTARSYLIPRSGLPARFFKIDLRVRVALKNFSGTTDLTPYALIDWNFLRVSIPTLNFDGKSQVTDFYSDFTEQIVSSPQLRAINITDISVEPSGIFANLQSTSLSNFSFVGSAATVGLVAIVQPTVTFFKKR